MNHGLEAHISSDRCGKCGGPAPEWKCPKYGLNSKSFKPSHWRDCRYGAKMQAECEACKQAESNCVCLANKNSARS